MFPSPPPTGDPVWDLVVPVKSLDRAKSRLAVALHADARRRLVLAMAADTVASALGADGVASVTVVTPDPTVCALARSLGAEVLSEPEDTPDDLNAALGRALRVASADRAFPRGTGVVSGDLPALTPSVLAEVLGAAGGHPRSFVADHHGTGTTMAFWGPSVPPRPSFGANSARGHAAAGSAELRPGDGGAGAAHRWAGAHTDVDEQADLAAILRLGPGPRTAAALSGTDPVSVTRDALARRGPQ